MTTLHIRQKVAQAGVNILMRMNAIRGRHPVVSAAELFDLRT